MAHLISSVPCLFNIRPTNILFSISFQHSPTSSKTKGNWVCFRTTRHSLRTESRIHSGRLLLDYVLFTRFKTGRWWRGWQGLSKCKSTFPNFPLKTFQTILKSNVLMAPLNSHNWIYVYLTMILYLPIYLPTCLLIILPTCKWDKVAQWRRRCPSQHLPPLTLALKSSQCLSRRWEPGYFLIFLLLIAIYELVRISLWFSTYQHIILREAIL